MKKRHLGYYRFEESGIELPDLLLHLGVLAEGIDEAFDNLNVAVVFFAEQLLELGHGVGDGFGGGVLAVDLGVNTRG